VSDAEHPDDVESSSADSAVPPEDSTEPVEPAGAEQSEPEPEPEPEPVKSTKKSEVRSPTRSHEPL
jgi:hypothetical protein